MALTIEEPRDGGPTIAVKTGIKGEDLPAYLSGLPAINGVTVHKVGRAETEKAILQWYAALDTAAGDVLSCGGLVLVISDGRRRTVTRVDGHLKLVTELVVVNPKKEPKADA